jgi:hypothetical protein
MRVSGDSGVKPDTKNPKGVQKGGHLNPFSLTRFRQRPTAAGQTIQHHAPSSRAVCALPSNRVGRPPCRREALFFTGVTATCYTSAKNRLAQVEQELSTQHPAQMPCQLTFRLQLVRVERDNSIVLSHLFFKENRWLVSE